MKKIRDKKSGALLFVPDKKELEEIEMKKRLQVLEQKVNILEQKIRELENKQ